MSYCCCIPGFEFDVAYCSRISISNCSITLNIALFAQEVKFLHFYIVE